MNRDSGTLRGKRTVWGGRACSAAGALLGVLVASRFNPVIRTFYQRLLAAGKPRKPALTACMRKLLTILNAMVRTGQRLDPSPAITDLKNSCYVQPLFQLLEKFRDGARVVKHYNPPATPCDRVIRHDEIRARVKTELREYRAGPDPVALLRSMREAQPAMAAMSSSQVQETPHGESIDRFLARLPSLWQ